MSDILERPRPPAALVSDSAVLEVPDCDTAFREGLGESRVVLDAVHREETASVDQDRYRIGSRSFGKPQIAELEFAVTIRDPHIGGRRIPFHDVVHRQDSGLSRSGGVPTQDDPDDSGNSFHRHGS